MMTRSTFLVFSTDAALSADVCASLSAHGWFCLHLTEHAAVLAALTERPAVILIDQRAPDVSALIADIRGASPPLNATPILTIGAADRGAVGAGGQLSLPLARASLLDLLRQWAGPLDDHAARVEPWSFRYKLLRLIGLDNADAMLLRLRDSLADAVADETAASAHRLAGLAGICGFPEVSEAWARVDRGDPDAGVAAVAASRAAIADIDAALADPAST